MKCSTKSVLVRHACIFLLISAAIGLTAQPVHAQSVVPEFGAGLNFNLTDIMADLSFGMSLQEARASIKASFQPRLGTKRVLVESGTPNLLYQYQERRYLLGVEADKRFMLTQLNENTEVGLFIGAFGGMTFNDYRGTDAKGSVNLAWEGMGGAYLSDSRFLILRLGYQYLPLVTQSVYPHRIGISFNFLITDDF